MELLQLRYFVEIAKHESMKEASKRLFVSQPSLSQSVRRLEKELNTELFRHEGRNIRLTEQGRSFFLRAERALRELDQGFGEMDGSALQGHVNIGTYMPVRPITECLKEFARTCPFVTFSFACLLLKTIKFHTEKGELFLYLYGNLYFCAQKVFIVINTLRQHVFIVVNTST